MEHQQRQPEDKQPLPPQPQQHRPRLQCPRCESHDTKFCYYNNYSLAQPRHFCRTCKRFWTQGGTLRNIPEGGRRKKVKTSPSSLAGSSSSSSGKAPTMHAGILDSQVPIFSGGVGINSFHAYYCGGAGSSSAFGGQAGDLNPRAITGNLSANPQAMAPDLSIMRPLLELHLQQLVQQPPQASLHVQQQNLMGNGGEGQGQPRPPGWPLQQVGAQQPPVSPAFAAAVAPASVPAPSSATADAEVPNWDCILDPSVPLTPPPSPPPPSGFM